MTRSEAMQHALGYAAGREDASGVLTVTPDDRDGFHAFAEAYATAEADYRAERRGFMTTAKAAYEAWQASAGRTIFSDIARLINELTAAEAAFESAGGRGVGLTERIDALRAEIYRQAI